MVIAMSIMTIMLSYNKIEAQSKPYSNYKFHLISNTFDTLIVEENTIIPNSVQLSSQEDISEVIYSINNNSIRIYNIENQTIVLKYRVFNFDLNKSVAVLDSSQIITDERIMLLVNESENRLNSRRLIESSELQYSGNFTRGISFGNTQDVVLNSNLNLQLSGNLGNGMNIRAAISDENIPLQAEGNTLILQEFNKVFIALEKDNTTIIAGDYELGRPDSYFMNYFKKLKGISVSTQHQTNDNWNIYNKASFAVSRGKFRRIQLKTQEGNQGPYRLDGENGEVFLQVLSGTEKIYADGRLLKRGENNDYIIDYNRAEVRFTPKLIIAANLRIIVEFEYAIQSYLRSLYATETSIKNNKWEFKLNGYSEQDSKSTTGNIELDTSDIRILREGGDNDNFKSGIFEFDTINSNENVKYNLRNGILEFAPKDSGQVYLARFSNFGSGQGDYIIDTDATANGRVYKYVGSEMGDYLPLIRLIPPEQKQMFTASANYSLSDSTQFFIESAISNYDKNRFSELGNEDNTSHSFVGAFIDRRKVLQNGDWEMATKAKYEFVKKGFQILNPYRTSEFVRDWNIDRIQKNNNQHFVQSSIKLFNKFSSIDYQLSSFKDSGQFNGLRHQPVLRFSDNKWLIQLNGDWLNSTSQFETSEFSRPRANIQKSIFAHKLELGFYFEKEKNIIKNNSDTLNQLSFNYDLYRFSIKTKTVKNHQVEIAYSNRVDDRVIDSELQRATESQSLELSGILNKQKNSTLQWQIVVRDYTVEDNYIEIEQAKRSLIGNINHRMNLFNNGIDISSYYESNSGQEPKLEFQFIQVQKGEGSYLWNDYNTDEIKQINEFEIAPFSDLASFEKISVFNNEFISTNRYVLNQSIRLDPIKILKNKNHLLAKLFFFSRYRIDQKLQNSDNSGLLNFIDFDLENEDLVSFNSTFDHSLFINRGNPLWDLRFTLRKINNKILQISGFDQRNNTQYTSRIRYNLNKQLDLLFEGNWGNQIRTTENFNGQNFDIESWSFNPQLNYRPNSRLRIITNLSVEKKKNTNGIEMEEAKIVNSGIEISWRQNSVSNLEFKLNYINIDYKGPINSPIEFEMLQGLKNGNNAVWGINYIRRVSTSMDIVINYNGRKPGSNSIINTATMQMRALF